MDHKLFLEKLSEVADWEWRDVPGQTNHNWRGDDEIPTPQYIHILQLKNQRCEGDRHIYSTIKNYTWGRKTFLLEKCNHCGMAKTKNSDWFEVESHAKTAQQAYYQEYKGEPVPETRGRPKNKVKVIQDGNRFYVENQYVVEDSEKYTIKRMIDK